MNIFKHAALLLGAVGFLAGTSVSAGLPIGHGLQAIGLAKTKICAHCNKERNPGKIDLLKINLLNKDYCTCDEDHRSYVAGKKLDEKYNGTAAPQAA